MDLRVPRGTTTKSLSMILLQVLHDAASGVSGASTRYIVRETSLASQLIKELATLIGFAKTVATRRKHEAEASRATAEALLCAFNDELPSCCCSSTDTG